MADLRIWKRGDQQAVHKPLLVLYAIDRVKRGSDRLLPFAEVDRDLKPLLERFGPPRSAHHPEYPFWRLQNDGIWEVVSDAPLRSRASNSDPLRSELLAKGARGGFKAELFATLKTEPHLATELCNEIFRTFFPEAIHLSIAEAVGIRMAGRP
ncbi:MAG: hypothetical protein JO264_04545 [Acidisphaera sp.]|nr:hypothetical protein [Acidisphaera sp.]